MHGVLLHALCFHCVSVAVQGAGFLQVSGFSVFPLECVHMEWGERERRVSLTGSGCGGSGLSVSNLPGL